MEVRTGAFLAWAEQEGAAPRVSTALRTPQFGSLGTKLAGKAFLANTMPFHRVWRKCAGGHPHGKAVHCSVHAPELEILLSAVTVCGPGYALTGACVIAGD